MTLYVNVERVGQESVGRLMHVERGIEGGARPEVSSPCPAETKLCHHTHVTAVGGTMVEDMVIRSARPQKPGPERKWGCTRAGSFIEERRLQ